MPEIKAWIWTFRDAAIFRENDKEELLVMTATEEEVKECGDIELELLDRIKKASNRMNFLEMSFKNQEQLKEFLVKERAHSLVKSFFETNDSYLKATIMDVLLKKYLIHNFVVEYLREKEGKKLSYFLG